MNYSNEPVPNEAMPLVALGYARLQHDPRAMSEPTSTTVGHVAYSIVDENNDGFCLQRHRNFAVVADWKRRVGEHEYAVKVVQDQLNLQIKGRENLMAQTKPIQAWLDGYAREIPKLEKMVTERKSMLANVIASEPPDVPTEVWECRLGGEIVKRVSEEASTELTEPKMPRSPKRKRSPKKAE